MLKAFFRDPEMIVGGANTPDTYDSLDDSETGPFCFSSWPTGWHEACSFWKSTTYKGEIMASFIWDVAFNFNALEDPGNHNKPFLLNGCVQFTIDPTTLSTVASSGPKRFMVGDTVSFNAYNRTPNANQEAYTIVGGSLKFRKGDTLTAFPSPADQDSMAIPVTSSSFLGSSAAIATPANAPGYSLHPVVEIKNVGEYYFTVELQVQGPNNQMMTFRVDPEMIVGGTN